LGPDGPVGLLERQAKAAGVRGPVEVQEYATVLIPVEVEEHATAGKGPSVTYEFLPEDLGAGLGLGHVGVLEAIIDYLAESDRLVGLLGFGQLGGEKGESHSEKPSKDVPHHRLLSRMGQLGVQSVRSPM
jgi:hypothetical protein